MPDSAPITESDLTSPEPPRRLVDPADALRSCRAAIHASEELKDLHGTAMAWGRLGALLQRTGDHPAALHAFDRSLAFLRRCGALKDVGIALNNKAVSLRELGRRVQAMECHERALEIRRQLGDDEGLAASLHNLGVLHADVGAYDDARSALEEARRLREALGHKVLLASTELRIGILHEQQGDTARATVYYMGVIAASETQADGTDNLAAALCHLGGLLIGQGDPERALPLLERARSLLKGVADVPGLSHVEFNLGMAHIARGRMDEGLIALSSAQAIQQRCGDVRHLSATLSARALVELRCDRLANAETLLRQALDIQDRLEEHGAKVHTLRLLGQCLAAQGHGGAARQCHSQAEQLSALLSLSRPDTSADYRDAQRAVAVHPNSRASGWLQ